MSMPEVYTIAGAYIYSDLKQLPLSPDVQTTIW